MKSIYPCLWFDGNAEEAARLYCSAFSNAELKTCTPMVVMFHIKGQQFMGLNGGPHFRPNPSISFFTVCDTEEELEHAWHKLAEGGNVLMPLDKYPWSEKYGWVQDKYGVSWQLSLGKVEDAGQYVSPCLLFCREHNGEAEQAIRLYTSLFDHAEIKGIHKYAPGDGDDVNHIKQARFTLNGQVFRAMDSGGPHNFSFDEGISLVVSCDTQQEIDFYWLNLTEGGQESMCGWCRDAFGVWWQIVPSMLGSLMSDPQKAPRVTEAFLKMKKFDIAALLLAAEGGT